jgi:hypothetical protein
MKTKLIQALRAVGKRLASGASYYNWHDADSCNCGLLAQEILNVDSKQLASLRVAEKHQGCWHASANFGFCTKTGLPLTLLFKALNEAGMSHGDFCDLEQCANPAVAARLDLEVAELRSYGIPYYLAGRSHFENQNRFTVSRYMLAWADLLEEQAGDEFETRPLNLTATLPAIPQDNLNPVEGAKV